MDSVGVLTVDQLAPQLQRLHALLDNKGCVRIEHVYRHLIGKRPASRRSAQQILGRYIARYKAAGGPGRIVPGHIKGTLQLRPR